MSAHCPLCGSRVYSLHTLRWSEALRQMPASMKRDAMRAQGDRSPTSGRWLYATKDGIAVCISPDQAAQLRDIEAEFGEDLED
jgi:hypothetical protein